MMVRMKARLADMYFVCRCGNVAAILELDEHLTRNFKVRFTYLLPVCRLTSAQLCVEIIMQRSFTHDSQVGGLETR